MTTLGSQTLTGWDRKPAAAGHAPRPWAERPSSRALLPIVLPVALLVVWQVAADRGLLSNALPPPTDVAAAFWRWVFGTPKSPVDVYAGTWLEQVTASAKRVAGGYALAALVGIPLGVLIGASRVAYLAIDPLIHALRTVPAPAWVPFSLVFFGLSPLATIWLIFLVAFFPIVVNTISGVQQVPLIYRNAALMLGASRHFVWTRVLLPAALPFVFVGLRLGVGMAWIAVVVSELVGVKSGLGYSLYQAYQFGRMDVMIATMVTLGVFGLLSDRAVGMLARRLVRS
jgi:NitT/TauT family transport system permease protein